MQCPVCGGAEAQPKRVVDEAGMVVEGCVDAYHSDAMLHLDGPEAAWHWRPEAIRHRAARMTEVKVRWPTVSHLFPGS